MALAKRLFLDYKDDTLAATDWTYEIHQEGYGGAASEHILGPDPVITRWQGIKWKNIVGSETTVTLLGSDDLTWLNASDSREIKIIIKKNAGVWWEGFALPLQYFDSLDAYPRYFTLSANDGLGKLRDFEFVDSDGDPYEGFDSAIDCLAQALQNTGLELPLRSVVNLFEDDMNVTDTDDPLKQADVWRDFVQSNELKPGNAYDMVLQIMKAFQAQIFQSAGRWWVRRVPGYEGTVDYRDFDFDNVNIEYDFNSNNSFDPAKTTGSDFVLLSGGAIETEEPFRQLTVRENFGKKDTIVKGSTFPELEFSGSDFIHFTNTNSGWAKQESDGEFGISMVALQSHTFDDSQYLASDGLEIFTQSFSALHIDFEGGAVPPTSNANPNDKVLSQFYVRLVVDAGGGNFYWFKNFTTAWQLESSLADCEFVTFDAVAPFGTIAVPRIENFNDTTNFGFQIQSFPANGTFTVYLHDTGYKASTGFTSDTIYIKGFTVRPVDISLNFYPETQDTVTVINTDNNLLAVYETFLCDSDISNNMSNVINGGVLRENVTNTPTDAWFEKDDPGTLKTLVEWYNNFSDAGDSYYIFRGEIYKPSDYFNTFNLTEYDDELFFWTDVEYNTRSGVWNGEAVQKKGVLLNITSTSTAPNANRISNAISGIADVSPSIPLKIFSDADFGIFDNNDSTKLAVFEASDITTETTRTYTFPDASGKIQLEELQAIGTPTYGTIQQHVTTTSSAGHIDGGEITDAGSQTYDVAAGSGSIRSTDSHMGELFKFDWSASSGVAINDDTIAYVYVDYNGGSPQINVKASFVNNTHTEFFLGSVVREGTDLHILNNPDSIVNFPGHVNERWRHDGFKRVEGLILGETGTRNITSTVGEVYAKTNEYNIDAIDTSGSDTFDSYVQDSLESSGDAQWDNINYDNGGALTEMNVNRYGVLWFYLETDGGMVCIYGTSNATLQATAEAESPPAIVPKRITAHGFIMGRGIFRKSGATFETIESAFETEFMGATISNHNALGGLQGGTAAEFFHLTSAEHTNITLNTDTDVSGNTWVLDEDNMASDDDTKVATQQSVKAYVDASAGADVKVAVDVGANADFLGAAFNDGVLRTDNAHIGYADGGDFVTLDTVNGIADTNVVVIDGTATDDYLAVFTANGLARGIGRDNGTGFAIGGTPDNETLLRLRTTSHYFGVDLLNQDNTGDGSGNVYGFRSVISGAPSGDNIAFYANAVGASGDELAFWADGGLIRYDDIVNEGTTSTKVVTVDSNDNLDFRTPAEILADAGGTADVNVAVDNGANAGFLGAAFNDGVLRSDNSTLNYADGGDFVTITANATTALWNAIKFDGKSLDAGSATPSDGNIWVYRSGSGLWDLEAKPSGAGTDEKVGVDVGATPDYLGAAFNDGALRTTNTQISYTDGGDFVTLAIVTGIADTNIVRIDHAAVADNDYARFTPNGLEGRSFAEVAADIGAGVGTASNREILWNDNGAVDGVSGVLENSGGLVFQDDINLQFGTGADITMDWSSANSQIEFREVGTNVIATLDDTGFMTVSAGFLAGSFVRAATQVIIDEGGEPGNTADAGQLYTKSDNKLYFKDGAGTENEVAFEPPP